MSKAQENRTKRPFSCTILGWLMAANLVITGIILVFVLIFGREGFKAGEMGVMVGIFGVVGILFLLPIMALLFFVTRGLFRMQRWSIIFAMILTLLGIPLSLMILSIGVVFFLIALGFLLFTLMLEIRCLKFLPAPQAGSE